MITSQTEREVVHKTAWLRAHREPLAQAPASGREAAERQRRNLAPERTICALALGELNQACKTNTRRSLESGHAVGAETLRVDV
jgi:hypothetical protein